MEKTPNPGSPETVEFGYKCPIIDNGRGRGQGDGLFVVSSLCPIHSRVPFRPDFEVWMAPKAITKERKP